MRVLVWTNLTGLFTGLAVLALSLFMLLDTTWVPYFGVPLIHFYIGASTFCTLVSMVGVIGTLTRRRIVLGSYSVIVFLLCIVLVGTSILVGNVSEALTNIQHSHFMDSQYTHYEADLMKLVHTATAQLYQNGGCSISDLGAVMCTKDTEWFQSFVQNKCTSRDVTQQTECIEIDCLCQSAVTNEIIAYVQALYICSATFCAMQFAILACILYIVCCSDTTKTRAVKQSQHQRNLCDAPKSYYP